MRSYCSFEYLGIILPLVVIVYNLVKKKYRWLVLLLCSYCFFYLISKELVIYLILATFGIHHFGIWLTLVQNRQNEELKTVAKSERKSIKLCYRNKQRKILALAVTLNLGILVVLKYSGFLIKNLNSLLAIFKLDFSLSVPAFIIPIGISFYTLRAISYLFDVYYEKIKADQSLGRLALYMSFFPLTMEGPICRYSEVTESLYQGNPVTYQNLTFGIQRIFYGLFKKMVIADRLNAFISNVFQDYSSYDGGIIFVGALLYTCQLYMEFSGTMDVVIGSGQIFGVRMPENFKQPFFSKSISEFWQRWHISLGLWFKDYLFYPLSMSKPIKNLSSKLRKRFGNHHGAVLAGGIALLAVWLGNGLWHGVGWNYIFFGLYHFALILTANFIEPTIKKIQNKLHINPASFGYKLIRIIKTSILVVIGELFFRAEGLKVGIRMFIKIFSDFSLQSFTNGKIYELGMDKYDFFILAIAVIIVLIISILKEKNIKIRQTVAKQNIVIRWGLYYALIIFIIVFGAYGTGYIPVDPIYANF